tara:strand:+ start:215 stop:616 length:402 start_codon:yes stop_codon:yes gene_type:complete
MSFKLNNPPFPKMPEIKKVSKNSINIPNVRENKEGKKSNAFMHPPYRDPNTKGPTVKRKGHHGWSPFESDGEVNLSKMSGLGPRTSFGGVPNPELTSKKKKKTKKVMKDGRKSNVVMQGKGNINTNWVPFSQR